MVPNNVPSLRNVLGVNGSLVWELSVMFEISLIENGVGGVEFVVSEKLS